MQKSQLSVNVLETKFREMNYQRHVEKVTEIILSKHANPQQAAQIKEAFMNAKSGNIKFNEHSRQYEINAKNEAMLCKLIEISQGKSCFLKQPEYASIQKNQSAISTSKTSLHLPYRQEKLRQIDEENKALAKRIYEKKGFVDRGKLRKEIDEYEKLKRHMQKFKSVSVFSSKPSKLPPLLKVKSKEAEQDHSRFSGNEEIISQKEGKEQIHEQSGRKRLVKDNQNEEKKSEKGLQEKTQDKSKNFQNDQTIAGDKQKINQEEHEQQQYPQVQMKQQVQEDPQQYDITKNQNLDDTVHKSIEREDKIPDQSAYKQDSNN